MIFHTADSKPVTSWWIFMFLAPLLFVQFSRTPVPRSDQWSYCQTGCGKMEGGGVAVSERVMGECVSIALLRFLHIRAILRQKEASSRNYVQLLSNNLNGSLYCKVQRSVMHTIFLWTVGSTVYMHSFDDKHPNRPVFDILHWTLALKALKYVFKNHGDQRVFQIWNQYICL